MRRIPAFYLVLDRSHYDDNNNDDCLLSTLLLLLLCKVIHDVEPRPYGDGKGFVPIG